MNENSNLEFRKIPSLNFLYEISEDGRIVRNVKSKHQMTLKLDTHHSEAGYYAFWTYRTMDGVRKVRRHMVHRLVAECWLGKCPEGLQVDHIDRNTHNNHFSNLRYVDQSGQMKNRKLGDRIIAQAKQNIVAWIEKVSIHVVLKSKTQEITLPSLCAAARYLANIYDCPVEHIRYKLKKRRSHIFDFDVSYRNAETAC